MNCEKEMQYTVYKHISPSGKTYVGITALNVEKRWNNGNGYKDCTLFYRAIQKYGWENINHEIVSSGLSKTEACEIERELIKQYMSQNMSYNCSTGGELSALGCVRTDEFKKKLSNANTGKHLSDETKRKISESHKGKTQEVTQKVIDGHKLTAEKLKGRVFSDQHRANISVAKKGKRLGAEHSQSIRIRCVTNGAVYAGINEAARALNLDASSVCKVCKGILNNHKGFVFEYVGDVM